MKTQQIIDWMKKHSERQAVVLGVDGYTRSEEFDIYFAKHFSKYVAERIVLIIMILLSEDDGQVYISNEEYDYHELGLEKLTENIKSAFLTGENVEILFTRRIEDEVEYPELERTYQYLFDINGLTDISFYNIPSKKRNYIKKLVGKMNLSLI